MSGHLARLIHEKLFVPMNDYELSERKATDSKSSIKIGEYKWVVYRTDEWYRRVNATCEVDICQDAELIADYLNLTEALKIVRSLNESDLHQPHREDGSLRGMYYFCTRRSWQEWMQMNEQKGTNT